MTCNFIVCVRFVFLILISCIINILPLIEGVTETKGSMFYIILNALVLITVSMVCVVLILI